MTSKTNMSVWVAMVVVAIIALGAYYYPSSSGVGFLGSTACDQTTCLTGGLRILDGVLESDGTFQAGSTGTAISGLNLGTCYIKAYATTIAASSTATVDCQGTAAIGTITATGSALAGVTSSDSVLATLSTTTAGTTGQGLTIIGSSASTTAGHIDLRVSNLTGATFTWPTTGSATGTVNYQAAN